MIITGYFFRGKTAFSADGIVDATNTDSDFHFDIVYETNSSNFANFSDTGNKTRLDYVSPYDGSTYDVNETSYSKWSYHIGEGVLPVYNGHNVGVKGGWEYSSGRSDFSFAQAVHSDGTTIQTDGSLYSSNFDVLGAGLTRFFRLVVVNKTGSNVKLKMLGRSGTTSGKHFGVYDFQTQIITYTDKFVGITSEEEGSTVDDPPARRPLLGTTASGLIESHKAGSSYWNHFYNLNSSTPAGGKGHIDRDTGAAADGKVDSSFGYKVEFSINIRLYESTSTWALPICGMEPWVGRISTGITIGGTGNSVDADGTAGSAVLGPMPAAGNVDEIRLNTGENTAYNSASISVLKLDNLNPGDVWTGGAGVQTIVSSMAASSPSSGNSRNKTWTNINASFSAGDSLIVTLTNTAYLGWVAGTIVINMNLSSHD